MLAQCGPILGSNWSQSGAKWRSVGGARSPTGEAGRPFTRTECLELDIAILPHRILKLLQQIIYKVWLRWIQRLVALHFTAARYSARWVLQEATFHLSVALLSAHVMR